MKQAKAAKPPKKVKVETGRRIQKAPDQRIQVAALPWRLTSRLEIMLVSSRETRRWIIPKGWPMAGRSHSAAAAIEAVEEAGLLGAIDDVAFGHFAYEKKLSRGKSALCRVDVFPLRVVRQRPNWPEQLQRDTAWFSAKEAAATVSDPELGELIGRFIAARGG